MNWLSRRLNTVEDAGERETYATAYRQAADLVDALGALTRQGRSVLPKVEMDRLLDEITHPLADSEVFPEAGHVNATTNPATVIDPRDHILWWDVAPGRSIRRYPWSRAELEALRANGVDLPDMDELHRRSARDCLRPVTKVRRQLVLVFHEHEKGEHPLLNQIQSLFEGWCEVGLDQCIVGGGADPVIPVLAVPTTRLDIEPLPPKTRWWRLSAGTHIVPRRSESYSNLDKLLSHPHVWLLRYTARLRAGSAEDLPGDNLLHGNLAHRLFERFFDAHPGWRDLGSEQTRAWLDGVLGGLIQTEGAVLLAPGQGVRRERIATTIERALLSLLQHLRSANIATVKPEYTAEAPFKGHVIAGSIDLLLADAAGRESVLDVKWGGEHYRAEMLQANRHLQLATYAYLRKQGGSTPELFWPDTAFFIVETGNVLAQDNTVFPNAQVFASGDGQGIAELWARVQSSFDWRWRQFSAGQVEVVAAGTEPDVDSVAPADGFAADAEPDRFDPFTALTGWEPSQ